MGWVMGLVCIRIREWMRMKVLPPSSRRQADVHRTSALNRSSPIAYPIKKDDLSVVFFYGVGDGTRTHNAWNHNPVLCQLNYTHHIQLLKWHARRDSNP